VHPVDVKVGRRVTAGHTALTHEEPPRASHTLPHSPHTLPLYALPPHALLSQVTLPQLTLGQFN
jgi:hypothetical protein